MPTLPQLSVVDAQGAIDRREISCLEYVQALVDQQAKTESLNGFVYFNPEALLQGARAHDEALEARTGRLSLAGIPLAIKDNIDCAGMPTAAGTAALRHAVPRANAPVVARVIEAGALAAGKANMHELAFGCTNDNGFFGPARNPYDPSRIPGEAAVDLPCWWRAGRCRRRSAPIRADRCEYRRRYAGWSAFAPLMDAIRPGASSRYRPRATRSVRLPAPSPT